MKIALVCGEPSGDQLGAGLAQALRTACPDVELVGVTGPQMRAAGVDSWLDCSSFAVMGYWAALRRLPSLVRARNKLLQLIRSERPAVLVGIDAPDLNLGVGRRAQAWGVRYVQYVCPSFWVWRTGRAQTLAHHCDLVLTVLPFEDNLCSQEGIRSKFVGHRLADELIVGPDDRKRAREQLGIAPDVPVLALLPGSRVQELTEHAPLFAAVAKYCEKENPNLQAWWAPIAGLADLVADIAGDHVCPGQARTLLQAADVALIKSGTATLEAALLGCPQVIAYKLGGIMQWLTTRRLGDLHSRDYGLPNLVAGERIVPEFIQDRAVPAAIGTAVLNLLTKDSSDAMRAQYATIRKHLAHGADAQAAAAVLAAGAT